MEWGGGRGVAWVECRSSWIFALIFASARFNMPTWFPIIGTSPAPFTAGYWVVDLRVSFVSMISQPQLVFDCLSNPFCTKWVRPFLPPWFDSIAQVRPGIPSLVCRQQGKMEKNVSVDHDSAYCAFHFLLLQTNPGALPLAYICRNMCQHCQAWRQQWLQPINAIKLGLLRLLASLCPCHFPDVFPSLIWYGPNKSGVCRVLILRWRLVGWGEVVCRALCCDAQWPGLLCFR